MRSLHPRLYRACCHPANPQLNHCLMSQCIATNVRASRTAVLRCGTTGTRPRMRTAPYLLAGSPAYRRCCSCRANSFMTGESGRCRYCTAAARRRDARCSAACGRSSFPASGAGAGRSANDVALQPLRGIWGLRSLPVALLALPRPFCELVHKCRSAFCAWHKRPSL